MSERQTATGDQTGAPSANSHGICTLNLRTFDPVSQEYTDLELKRHEGVPARASQSPTSVIDETDLAPPPSLKHQQQVKKKPRLDSLCDAHPPKSLVDTVPTAPTTLTASNQPKEPSPSLYPWMPIRASTHSLTREIDVDLTLPLCYMPEAMAEGILTSVIQRAVMYQASTIPPPQSLPLKSLNRQNKNKKRSNMRNDTQATTDPAVTMQIMPLMPPLKLPPKRRNECKRRNKSKNDKLPLQVSPPVPILPYFQSPPTITAKSGQPFHPPHECIVLPSSPTPPPTSRDMSTPLTTIPLQSSLKTIAPSMETVVPLQAPKRRVVCINNRIVTKHSLPPPPSTLSPLRTALEKRFRFDTRLAANASIGKELMLDPLAMPTLNDDFLASKTVTSPLSLSDDKDSTQSNISPLRSPSRDANPSANSTSLILSQVQPNPGAAITMRDVKDPNFNDPTASLLHRSHTTTIALTACVEDKAIAASIGSHPDSRSPSPSIAVDAQMNRLEWINPCSPSLSHPLRPAQYVVASTERFGDETTNNPPCSGLQLSSFHLPLQFPESSPGMSGKDLTSHCEHGGVTISMQEAAGVLACLSENPRRFHPHALVPKVATPTDATTTSKLMAARVDFADEGAGFDLLTAACYNSPSRSQKKPITSKALGMKPSPPKKSTAPLVTPHQQRMQLQVAGVDRNHHVMISICNAHQHPTVVGVVNAHLVERQVGEDRNALSPRPGATLQSLQPCSVTQPDCDDTSIDSTSPVTLASASSDHNFESNEEPILSDSAHYVRNANEQFSHWSTGDWSSLIVPPARGHDPEASKTPSSDYSRFPTCTGATATETGPLTPTCQALFADFAATLETESLPVTPIQHHTVLTPSATASEVHVQHPSTPTSDNNAERLHGDIFHSPMSVEPPSVELLSPNTGRNREHWSPSVMCFSPTGSICSSPSSSYLEIDDKCPASCQCQFCTFRNEDSAKDGLVDEPFNLLVDYEWMDRIELSNDSDGKCRESNFYPTSPEIMADPILRSPKAMENENAAGLAHSSTETQYKNHSKCTNDDKMPEGCVWTSWPCHRDVLCGRGEGQNHLGTKVYRLLVQTKAEAFAMADQKGKTEIVAGIMKEIFDQGGRFLAVVHRRRYYTISNPKAYIKTMEALKAASHTFLLQKASSSHCTSHRRISCCDRVGPCDADIIIHAGPAVASGTIAYRDLLKANTETFRKAKVNEKKAIAQNIVFLLCSQKRRFFNRDKSGQWINLSIEEAVSKAYQSLSECWLKNWKYALKQKSAKRDNAHVSFLPDAKDLKCRGLSRTDNTKRRKKPMALQKTTPFTKAMSTMTHVSQAETVKHLLCIPKKKTPCSQAKDNRSLALPASNRQHQKAPPLGSNEVKTSVSNVVGRRFGPRDLMHAAGILKTHARLPLLPIFSSGIECQPASASTATEPANACMAARSFSFRPKPNSLVKLLQSNDSPNSETTFTALQSALDLTNTIGPSPGANVGQLPLPDPNVDNPTQQPLTVWDEAWNNCEVETSLEEPQSPFASVRHW